jgi:uncharacterized repeat protein (TIGR03803 family)
MHGKQQLQNSRSRTISRAAATALAVAIVFVLAMVSGQSAQAQTYNVIHPFTGGQDGGNPQSGPTLDRAGNLYGTTFEGGTGYGVVYKLSHHGSSWALSPLYSFTLGADGGFPWAGVTFGPNGTLFGAASVGTYDGGTVFNLRPQPRACSSIVCPWTNTVIQELPAGSNPQGSLVFDSAGNLYGTTPGGGTHDHGSVFELTFSAGTWTETVIHTFAGFGDGGDPGDAGVTLDSAGNLYGTTYDGGTNGWGTVFELTRSGSSWTKTILYSFQNGNDGHGPDGGVVFDRAGNLYGGTLYGGAGGEGGIIYQLSPSKEGWTLTILHTFSGIGGTNGKPTIDSSGNIYGATVGDGAYRQGSVFKLTQSGGGWSFTDLYDFTGGDDGGSPPGGVAVDASGNLYGTASQGGSYGWGVVWEITP